VHLLSELQWPKRAVRIGCTCRRQPRRREEAGPVLRQSSFDYAAGRESRRLGVEGNEGNPPDDSDEIHGLTFRRILKLLCANWTNAKD